MKKIFLKILSAIMICVVIGSSVLPICASDGISDETIPNYDDLVEPCFDNLGSATTGFSVIDGVAYVAVSYDAYSSKFSYATLTVKIQKQFLGIFWTDINIGDNNQWIGYCYDIQGVFVPSFNVNGNGNNTYRALLTLRVYGNDGTVDVLERTIKSSNS